MKVRVVLASLIAVLVLPVWCAPPVPGVDVSPFGSQIPWPQDTYITDYANKLQSAGVQWARSELIWWGLCEQSAGVYNYDVGAWDCDNWLSLLQARGIKPYCILCYGNTLYGGTPNTPAGRAAFVNWVTATVTRYKDQVDVWEIWNEPNLEQFWGVPPNAADYAALVAAAAPAIRAADPSCIVVGAATSGIDRAFLTTCFQNGMLGLVDVVSVHPYRINLPESINSEIASLRTEMNTYANGPAVKIWTGEWGYNAGWTEITTLDQAKMLSRMMLNNLSQGIQLSIWFSVHGWATTEDWGLTDLARNPRESHTAMQILNQRMPAPVAHIANPYSVTFVPDYPSSYRSEVYERGGPDRRTVGLWRARWPPVTTSLVSDVTLTMPQDRDLRAYSALDGSEILLQHLWNILGGTVTLDQFEMWDYPVLLEVNKEPLPAGAKVTTAQIASFSADSNLGGYPPSLAFDGQITVASKWTTTNTAPPHWAAVQFNAPQFLTGAVLRMPSMAGESYYYGAKSVELQTAPTLSGPWTTHATALNAIQHDRIAIILGTSVTASCARILVNDTGIDNYARIPEIELYSAGTAPVSLSRFHAD